MNKKLYVITSDAKPILIVEDLNNPKVNIAIDEYMKDFNKEATRHSYLPQNDMYYEIEFYKKNFGENTLRVFYSRTYNMKCVFRYYEFNGKEERYGNYWINFR